jgi:hypothetical protein
VWRPIWLVFRFPVIFYAGFSCNYIPFRGGQAMTSTTRRLLSFGIHHLHWDCRAGMILLLSLLLLMRAR